MKKVTRVVLVVSLALNVLGVMYVAFIWFSSYWAARERLASPIVLPF